MSTTSSAEPANMPCARTVVCSPHFDDAVLNCWSVLEREKSCAVVNVFTGIPESSFTSWYDQMNGASSSAAHMQQRAQEDRDALSVVGKIPTDLGLLDAQYRLCQSALLHATIRRVYALRFLMLRLPFVGPPLYTTPAPDAQELAESIAQAVPGASCFCVPAGIGGHRDHLLVRQAAVVLASRGMTVRLYADMPYAVHHGWPEWVVDCERERRDDRASALWSRHLKELRPYLGDPIKQARVVRLTLEERARKMLAVSRYTSQIDALRADLTRSQMDEDQSFAYEVYWELQAPDGRGDQSTRTNLATDGMPAASRANNM